MIITHNHQIYSRFRHPFAYYQMIILSPLLTCMSRLSLLFYILLFPKAIFIVIFISLKVFLCVNMYIFYISMVVFYYSMFLWGMGEVIKGFCFDFLKLYSRSYFHLNVSLIYSPYLLMLFLGIKK